jgi:hypothetical protein
LDITGEGAKDGSRKSTCQWDTALKLALNCVEKFQEPAANFEGIEERANNAFIRKTGIYLNRLKHA